MSLADAVSVVDEAVAEHDISRVFALFSGGHDSLASTLVASEHEAFAGVVHINTGIGIEQTREFVRGTCEREGWELHEVFAPEGLYEEMVLTRGGFPGGLASHNSMLFYLKQQPLNRWFKAVEGARVGFVTGIRKQESVRRMHSDISVPVRRDGRKVWISPILDWSKVDCGRVISDRGLPRNPVVDLLHRSGECLCGALAQSREIHEIDQWFPDTGQRIHDLERECERRGIAASVWAGRNTPADGQQQLFSKAELAPLCTSCVARDEREAA